MIVHLESVLRTLLRSEHPRAPQDTADAGSNWAINNRRIKAKNFQKLIADELRPLVGRFVYRCDGWRFCFISAVFVKFARTQLNDAYDGRTQLSRGRSCCFQAPKNPVDGGNAAPSEAKKRF